MTHDDLIILYFIVLFCAVFCRLSVDIVCCVILYYVVLLHIRIVIRSYVILYYLHLDFICKQYQV